MDLYLKIVDVYIDNLILSIYFKNRVSTCVALFCSNFFI